MTASRVGKVDDAKSSPQICSPRPWSGWRFRWEVGAGAARVPVSSERHLFPTRRHGVHALVPSCGDDARMQARTDGAAYLRRRAVLCYAGE